MIKYLISSSVQTIVFRRGYDIILTINGSRVKAPGSHARVGRAGGEHLRVGGCHDVGHHGTGAGAGDEDLAGVGTVLVDGIGDHIGDGIAVASTVVGERGRRRNIPASAAVGRLGVDDLNQMLIEALVYEKE